jgi:hypothetical protein
LEAARSRTTAEADFSRVVVKAGGRKMRALREVRMLLSLSLSGEREEGEGPGPGPGPGVVAGVGRVIGIFGGFDSRVFS